MMINYGNDLIAFNLLLNQPNIDFSQFNTVDNFKIDIVKTICSSFLKYPELTNLTFDFVEIDRISKVWEGSAEELLEISVFINDPNIDIEMLKTHNSDIHISFNFMSKEPSFLAGLLKEMKENDLVFKQSFRGRNINGTYNPTFIPSLNNFLGKSIVSNLTYQDLSKKVLSNEQIRTTKIKI